MTKHGVARLRQAISLPFMACHWRTMSGPFLFIRYAYLKWFCLGPIRATHFNTEYMKYEPQIISVNRGFSFAHVSLSVHQVKCFDNFQTIFNQFSMIS